MNTIEITRMEDVREGDVVTVAYKGHEITGKVWHDGGGLYIGGVALAWYNEGLTDRTFVRATREGPSLPTEPYSVIVDVTTRDGDTERILVLDEAGYWCEPVTGDEYEPEHITAFTLAHIVPATETTTEESKRCGGCWDLGPHNYGPGCDYKEDV